MSRIDEIMYKNQWISNKSYRSEMLQRYKKKGLENDPNSMCDTFGSAMDGSKL